MSNSEYHAGNQALPAAVPMPPRGVNVYFGETFIHVSPPQPGAGRSVTVNDLWIGPRGGFGRKTPPREWELMKSLLAETGWAAISVYRGTRRSGDTRLSDVWPSEHWSFAPAVELSVNTFVVGTYVARVGHWLRVVQHCQPGAQILLFDKFGPIEIGRPATPLIAEAAGV